MARIDEVGVEWVTIEHPGVDGETEVTREALDEVWADKGWREVKESKAAKADAVKKES